MSKLSFVQTISKLSEGDHHSNIHQSEITVELSPAEKKRKRKLVIAILAGLAISQSVILMVSSFLPIYVEEHYPKINLTMVGFILR